MVRGWITNSRGRPGTSAAIGAIVAEIGHLVREILADDCNLERTVIERESCIDEPVGRALPRVAGVVVAAEASADIGVVGAADELSTCSSTALYTLAAAFPVQSGT